MLVHRAHCRVSLGDTRAVFEWFTSHVSVAFHTIDAHGDDLFSPLHEKEMLVLCKWCHEVFGSEHRRMRWRFNPRLNIYHGDQLVSAASAFEFHYHSDVTLFVTRWQGVPDSEFPELA